MSSTDKNVRRQLTLRQRRIELCASAAIGAIVLGVTTAGAQSYNATPVADPSFAFVNSSPNVTDVAMNSTTAVIRWDVTPGSGTHDFQSAGTTATFHYTSDFTVLNVVNIDPSRAIKFNGTTNSLVGTSPGGSVWFYSPGGIIVGATASFNVGSLLLTTSTPSDLNQNFDSSAVSLNGALDAASAIVIQSGASITASNYVAMVAPHIDQLGTVRAGGEVAYVAGRAANLTFPTGSGLFSIEVTEGTDATNGQGQVLVHTGTTSGPAADSGTPDRNIYFVAIPKNTAITTLLGGSIGYDAAGGAAVNNESIYLVGNGVIESGFPYLNSDFQRLDGFLDEIPSNLTIASGTAFQQDFTAYATNIAAQALTGDTTFAKSATLFATLTNTLDIASGHGLTTAGDLALYAQGRDDLFNLIGGSVSVTNSGLLQVGAALSDRVGLTLNAASTGAPESDPTGGTVSLSITGGDVVAGLDGITLNANGTGGDGFVIEGGDGIGGTATLSLAGTINTSGEILVSANGIGGGGVQQHAGEGIGGNASFTAAPGNGVTTPSIAATLIKVSADGTGGLGFCPDCTGVGAPGGAGQGGTANLTANSAVINTNAINVTSLGNGGQGADGSLPNGAGAGGSGTGGLATIDFLGGTITTFGISAQADGTGGEGGAAFGDGSGGLSGNGGAGGVGGGGASINSGGAALNLVGATLLAGEGTPTVNVSSVGTGGNGGRSVDANAGDGGFANGGDAIYTQTTGSIVSASLLLNSSADAGNGGNNDVTSFHSHGGDATGGVSSFYATGGGTFNGSILMSGGTQNGVGGGGPSDIAGFHGAMRGGASTTTIDGTAVTVSSFVSDTSASTALSDGLPQYHGAVAAGGGTSVVVQGGGSLTAPGGSFFIFASGVEQGGTVGGANGNGGAVTIRATTGSTISAAGAQILSEGFGGVGGSGTGGNGQAGAITILADNSTIDLGSVLINGQGGAGSSDTGGSSGTGSTINITAQNGGLFKAVEGLSVSARGYIFGDNDTANGGSIALTADGGTLTTGDLTADVSSQLGSHVGSGNGGSISITATGSPTLSGPSSFGTTDLQASGATNSGTIALRNDIAGGANVMSFGDLNLGASGPATDQVIHITTNQSAISALSGSFGSSGGILFSSSGTGTFAVLNDLAFGSSLFVRADTGGSTPNVQANNLYINSAGDFTAAAGTTFKATHNLQITADGDITAGTLTAGNSIFVETPGNITVNTATVTDPARIGDVTLDQFASRLQLNAGYFDGPDNETGNVTINNRASAGGVVLIQSTADINIGAGAVVQSDNQLTFNAGDDIIVGSGATVSGAVNELYSGAGFADLTAGDGNGASEVHSLINAGTLNSNSETLTISADAIQSTGTIAGDTILATLSSTSFTGDDGGALLATCTAGNLCVNAITSGGNVAIGTFGRIPTTTRISGNVTAFNLDASSLSGIVLGGSTPATMNVTGGATFDAGSGSLTDAGTVAVNANTIIVNAGADLNAPSTSFQATGDISFDLSGSIIAKDLIAGGQLGPGPNTLGGQLSVSGRISAGTGGINFSAPGGITLGRVTLGDGTALTLNSGTSALTITDASANAGARAGVVSLHGRAITIGQLAASSTVDLTGTGLVKVTTDLAAGGAVTVSGNGIDITSAAGPLNVASASSTGTLALTSGGALTLTSGSASGSTTLNAGAAGLTVGTSTSGGAFTATSGGAIGYTSISAPQASLTAAGGISFGTLNVGSFGTATLVAGGAISGSGQFTAGGGLSITGGSINLTSPGALSLGLIQATSGNLTINMTSGALTIANGSAAGSATINGSSTVDIGNFSATGNLSLSTTANVTFTQLAGNNVNVFSLLGAINGQRLTAAGTAGLSASGAVSVTTDLAAAGTVTANGAGIALTSASGPLTVALATSSANLALNSGGALTLTSGSSSGTTTLNAAAGLTIGTSTSTSAFTATGASIGYTTINASQATLNATGGIGIGTLNVGGGTAALTAGGAISGSGQFTTGTLSLTGGSINLITTGQLALTSASATAGDLSLNTTGALFLTTGSATGNATISSGASAGFGMNINALTVGGTTNLSSTGSINVADIATPGAVSANATDINLTSTGPLSVASLTSTGNVALTTASGLTIGTSTSTGAFTGQSGADITYTSINASQASLTAVGAINGGQLIVTGSGTATFLAGGAIVNNGQLRADGGLSVTGSSVNLSTPGALTLALVKATAGDVTLTPGGALIVTSGSATGKATINGAGSVSLPSFTTGGDLIVNGANGVSFGTISGANVTAASTTAGVAGQRLIATGTVNLSGATGVAITTDITTPNGLTLNGPTIALTSLGALNIANATATSNSVSLTAGGNLTVQNATAPGAITLVSGSGAITAGTLASGGAIGLTAAKGIGFTSLTGASATLAASGGDIAGGRLALTGKANLQASGAIRLTDPVATGSTTPSAPLSLAGANDSLGNGGDLLLNAGTDILINNAVTGGRALLTSNGAVSISQLRSGGDMTISARNDIGFTSLTGNAVSLTSSAGTISGEALAASYTTNLTSFGLLQVTNLSSADLVTGAGRSITLLGTAPLTLASLTSTGAVRVTAGALTVNGAVQGTTIDLGSTGIAIGSSARIGNAGTTTSVTFRNTGTGRSFIGATGSGYQLASAGLARVQADSITLILPQATGSSATQPDVVIGDVTLHGSTGTPSGTLANLTAAGSFAVQTPGRVQVTGKLLLTDLAAGNAATITAGQTIDVVAPNGSVLMTDTSGAAKGTLTFVAPRVTIATAQAITDLGTTTGIIQRDTRLATNDGAVVEQGYAVGGKLVFRVADALNIQNSGGSATADRRGFTAGTDGIEVVATGTQAPEVILNGRQAATAGGFVTGSDMVSAVKFSSSSAAVSASSLATVNGCAVTGCGTLPAILAAMQEVPPSQDLVDMLDEAEDNQPQTAPDATRPLIATPEAAPFSFAPVIDEPVVGIGTESVGFVAGDTGGIGDVPQNGSFSTGPATGDNVGVPQNSNLGTGPAGGDINGVPQNGSVGTGPANGDTGNVPQSGTPDGGTPGGGGTGDNPQNGDISTGPAGNDRGSTTPQQR